MKKTLIPLLALAACITAHAAWKVVAPLEASNGKWAVYMDDEGIQKEGQRVRVWTLYDLAAAQLTVRDKEVRSIRDHIEIDCARSTYASMASHYSDQTMGRGEVILNLGASPEEDLVPKSALGDVAKKVCAAR